MDLSTLFAGAVQAAPPTAAAASAAAPVPAADAAGDGGFASLVALALGETCFAPEAPSSAAEAPCGGPSGPRVRAADADDAPVDEAASPLDAPVDATTLSVLIALATPVAVAPVTPDPVPVAPPAVDGAAIEAVGVGVEPTAVVGADVAPVPTAGRPTAAPTPPTAEDAAFTVAEPSRAEAPIAPVEAPVLNQLAGDAPPVAGEIPLPPQPVAAPAAPASAAQPAAQPAVAEAPAGATAVTPTSAPSPAPTPTPTPTPTPAPTPAPTSAQAQPASSPAPAPASSTRPDARRVAPLRAALAAMAAGDTPTDAQPAANAPVRDARHVAAPAATPLTAPPALADAGPAVPRRDLASPAPSATPHVVALAASRGDAGSSARDGADAQPNSGGAAAPQVALPRIDAATPVAGADPVAGAATAPLTAPVTAPVPAPAATPELGLGRVELSSAARFEQTLAALDPDTRNLQAMVRTVRLFSAADGASEARLQLDPEHLGPVALTVRVEQGTVSAHFRAETPAAQRWIETHQQELRAGLREQGLEVRDLVVTTDPDGRRDRRQDAPPARPARPRRSAANEADLPRFEVLV